MIGRMDRKALVRLAGLATLAAALIVTALAACNGGGDGPIKPPSVLIGVKPGAWQVSISLTNAGSGCPTVTIPGGTFCQIYPDEIDPESLLGGFGLFCDAAVGGTAVTVSCSGELEFNGCTYTYSGAGSGTMGGPIGAYSSFVLPPTQLRLTRTAGSGLCPASCTYTVSATGLWTGETCPAGSPDLDGAFTLTELFRSALAEAP